MWHIWADRAKWRQKVMKKKQEEAEVADMVA